MSDDVLVIADDRATRAAVLRLVGDAGMTPAGVRDVRAAVRRHRNNPPDAALLHLGALDVPLAVSTFRESFDCPLLTMSERGPSVLAQALDAGADEHLELPLDGTELGARYRAVMRRHRLGRPRGRLFVTPDFAIDLVARRAFAAGKEVRLSPKEWDIVELLVANAGRLLTHEEILESVWGHDHLEHSEYLRVHMHTIRHKLEPQPSEPRYFHTVPGLGLRLDSTGRPATRSRTPDSLAV